MKLVPEFGCGSRSALTLAACQTVQTTQEVKWASTGRDDVAGHREQVERQVRAGAGSAQKKALNQNPQVQRVRAVAVRLVLKSPCCKDAVNLKQR
jgi:hypothetical protein